MVINDVRTIKVNFFFDLKFKSKEKARPDQKSQIQFKYNKKTK